MKVLFTIALISPGIEFASWGNPILEGIMAVGLQLVITLVIGYLISLRKTDESEVNKYLFENVVDEWLKVKSRESKPLGGKTIKNSLENFILPFVATCSVKDISLKLVMEVLEPIKKNGDMQVLLRNHLYFHEIMEHAKRKGLLDHNPLDKLNINITT